MAIDHLEKLRQDIRDEIKRRIEQRDKYSIQLSIALGAIVAVAFSATGFRKVLIAAPLVSVYFTVLILYSYRIHKVATAYLRDVIEPELAQRYGISHDIEWETYYNKKEVPGIRRSFFIVSLWVVTFFSLLYLWLAERAGFEPILSVASAIYVLAAFIITYIEAPNATKSVVKKLLK